MKNFINQKLQSMVGKTFNTKGLQQRGVADLIELMSTNLVLELKSDDIVTESATSRRSIEDVQLRKDGQLYKVDVKSHETTSEFSMPNLISIDRLKTFYRDPNNHLIYIFIGYYTSDEVTVIESVEVRGVEELDWSILAIQNLGKGQLQIKNMNNDLVFTDIPRQEWINILKAEAIKYYTKLITKIERLKIEWENE